MTNTKNRQSKQKLEQMAARAFGDIRIKDYKELTEGMCNVAYWMRLENNQEVILKIAPEDKSNLLSCEVELMAAEVEAMELAAETTSVPHAKVLYYDNSHTICASEYFFMEKLEGDSMFSQRDNMSSTEWDEATMQIGRYLKELHQVTGEKFGFFGNKKGWQDSLFACVKMQLEEIMEDIKRAQVELPIPAETIMSQFMKDAPAFEEVKTPVFVFWDSWDGNVFVKDKKVCGMIDWERTIWGDYLMEDKFRHHSISDAFLKGYGKTSFTENEKKRSFWYDCYLYLVMMTEGAPIFRNYPDDGQYQWVKGLFIEIWTKEMGA